MRRKREVDLHASLVLKTAPFAEPRFVLSAIAIELSTGWLMTFSYVHCWVSVRVAVDTISVSVRVPIGCPTRRSRWTSVFAAISSLVQQHRRAIRPGIGERHACRLVELEEISDRIAVLEDGAAPTALVGLEVGD